MPSAAHPALPRWLGSLAARGRYSFLLSEAAAELGRTPSSVSAALRREARHGSVGLLRNGFYVLVPPEHRAVGSPPASWFVDELMQFLGQPYYVGLLTAAALHGAGHQQPMVFQVVTDRQTRPVELGKVRIAFHQRARIDEIAVTQTTTDTGTMRVATAEATAFDLVHHQEAVGSIDRVLEVLHELRERLDPVALAACAARAPTPDVQRLGFLLEFLSERDLVVPLSAVLEERRVRVVRLATGGALRPGAELDLRWRVVKNWNPEPSP